MSAATKQATTAEYIVQERPGETMLILQRDWQFGWRCIACRPRLLTNDQWRPTAERIVSALIKASVQP